jgi:hypothetical protein
MGNIDSPTAINTHDRFKIGALRIRLLRDGAPIPPFQHPARPDNSDAPHPQFQELRASPFSVASSAELAKRRAGTFRFHTAQGFELSHLPDDRLHVRPRERPQGFRANVPQCCDAQRERSGSHVVW